MCFVFLKYFTVIVLSVHTEGNSANLIWTNLWLLEIYWMSTFGSSDMFKNQLIRVLDQHVPIRRRAKSGKVWKHWTLREVNLVKKRKEESILWSKSIAH